MTEKTQYLVIDGQELIREYNQKMADHYTRINIARQKNAEEKAILDREEERFSHYAPRQAQMSAAREEPKTEQQEIVETSIPEILRGRMQARAKS
jgi:hypothetical protein